MKKRLVLLQACLLTASATAVVRVCVEDSNGAAAIRYQCTAGEVVRSFALDVRVSQGAIVGITNFFRGESRAEARGYGIFPAAFRDHIVVSSGTNANWEVSGYTPLAVVADSPSDTLPGLNSNGVTLEFGGLWDASIPASVPSAAGTLCTLQISEPAQVSVAGNTTRGGAVAALTGVSIEAVFAGAIVDPSPLITDIRLSGDVITVSFQGGELETSAAVNGPWGGTGNTSGIHTNSVPEAPVRFYRVRQR